MNDDPDPRLYWLIISLLVLITWVLAYKGVISLGNMLL